MFYYRVASQRMVDAVVGENGAFYFWCDADDGKFHSCFIDSDADRKEKRIRLNRIKDEILQAVPGAGIASDQNFREADLAIDFCEDVAPLSREKIDRICRIFTAHGAICKVSSIHVNGWFGDYSKIGMTRAMVSQLWGRDLDDEKERTVFFGDSPNDEPMFDYFPHSIGVRNVLQFEDRLKVKPAYITPGEGGLGFAQAVAHILKHR